MNNQRYRNENATPRDLPPVMEMRSDEGKVFCRNVPLAMAYVPDRKWGEVYDLEVGFHKGTIFPCLDFPLVGCGKGRCVR